MRADKTAFRKTSSGYFDDLIPAGSELERLLPTSPDVLDEFARAAADSPQFDTALRFEPDSGRMARNTSNLGNFFTARTSPTITDFIGTRPNLPASASQDQDGISLASTVKNIRNSANTISSGLGTGVLNLESALGTLMQAPLANIQSGAKSSAATLDRIRADLMNKISPGSARPNASIQRQAQLFSRYAAEMRKENAETTFNLLARAGKVLENDGRERAAMVAVNDARDNPALLQQQKRVAEASGFGDTVRATIDNPLALIYMVAKSVPEMAVGGAAGRIAALRGVGAVNAASRAGAITGAVTSGLAERESRFSDVMQIPFATLKSNSPRYNEILAQVSDAKLAREVLANEIADGTPMLFSAVSLAGTGITKQALDKLPSGARTPAVSPLQQSIDRARSLLKKGAQRGGEALEQGVPQDVIEFAASENLDPNARFDVANSVARNLVKSGASLGIEVPSKLLQSKLDQISTRPTSVPAPALIVELITESPQSPTLPKTAEPVPADSSTVVQLAPAKDVSSAEPSATQSTPQASNSPVPTSPERLHANRPADVPANTNGRIQSESRKPTNGTQTTNPLTTLMQIASTHPTNKMVKANTPELLPALRQLFASTSLSSNSDIRSATRQIKQQLKTQPELKQFWNRISDSTFRKAANQVLDRNQRTKQPKSH